ncbi:MAG: O-antigen ligase family protein [Luteolibacter sp.]
MNASAAVFLFLSLVFSVFLGSQTRSWSWGPALLTLAVAVGISLPALWKKGLTRGNEILLAIGALTVGWIAWRAAVSPVRELAAADLMLLASAVGAFVATQTTIQWRSAGTIFLWGLAALATANLVVVCCQIADPQFSAIFSERPVSFASGFFSHYNEGANFLIGSSFLLAGAACFGERKWPGRIVFGLLAISGLAAVYYTRSRGGILGVAIGLGVFGIFALVHGKRQKAKWFAPLAILFPVLAIIGVGIFLKSWATTQEARSSSIDLLMDNTIRLQLFGIALSSIGLHPLAGGGSRSFSWECYQFWNFRDHGANASRPELVHNELLQAATDYGLIGAGLIVILLFGVFLVALVRSGVSEKSSATGDEHAWRIGGIAALAGMLCQSSFSFVFHLLPGAILLGIALAAAMALPLPARNGGRAFISPTLLGLSGACTAIFLTASGWTANRLGLQLFPLYLKATAPVTDDEKMERFSEAIRISPEAAFYKERAFLRQKQLEEDRTDLSSAETKASAIEDYRAAISLHPYDAMLTINLANLLGSSGNDEEAEIFYRKTIALQGGMEAGFKGIFLYAEHLLKKGSRLLNAEKYPEAQEAFETAADQLDALAIKSPWILPQKAGIRLKTGIYEGLGLARESNEDYKGAFEAYERMAENREGAAGKYRAAALYAKLAAMKWNARQPSQSLALFLKAQETLRGARQLPTGISATQKQELTRYIEQSISFLQKARNTPSDSGY